MAEESALSWVDELAPMPLTPRNLLRDLQAADRVYSSAGVPMMRRAAFLMMRLGQRIAYSSGWMLSSLEDAAGRSRTKREKGSKNG